MSTMIAAVVTDVGKVRDHNEDAHLIDPDNQVFIVADGMGGHAAGEVASTTAVKSSHRAWISPTTRRRVEEFAAKGDAESRRALVHVVREGVMQAHLSILEAAQSDRDKKGMGTTFTGLVVAGGDAVFAHAGDSRAYLIRDGIAMQLSEDHTLLARLQAAGVDAAAQGSDPARWKGVLTNALGMGGDTRVATFFLSLYSGDRILLCSDGVHDYFEEAEVGEVVTAAASPALAARKLVELALDRGGEDNATAVVIKVMEAGETTVPPEQRTRDEAAIAACRLFEYLTPRERLRALRITTPREIKAGKPLAPVALGERVAYIVLEGEATQPGKHFAPGDLIYAEALVQGTEMPDREMIVQAITTVRLLTIRRDDFLEITEEEAELGVKMYAVLAQLMRR
ncbi:MAG TPA: protein phosphatase 2C domain-containing protein [Kofleriaceae bacterium]|nr:protein phosphatase 2C domain-containing protein [Kofleriaceae bacterium]